MSANDCVRVNTNHLSFDHGNYQDYAVTDYQIACMPNEVPTVGPPLSQQRIDPTVILPIFDPFGDELNNATSGGKRMSSVRAVSSVRNKNKNANAAAAVLTSNRNSFFADNTAKLFARTVNASAHRLSHSAAASPNTKLDTPGSHSASPKHSSLALLQSVSRTSTLEDAKSEEKATPPTLLKTRSIENDTHSSSHRFSTSKIKSNNSKSNSKSNSKTASPIANDSRGSNFGATNRRPPLPARSNSARFGKGRDGGSDNVLNSAMAHAGATKRPPPLPSRPLPNTPQRDRRGGMVSSPQSDSKDDTESSDSDSDTDNDNNNNNNNATFSSYTNNMNNMNNINTINVKKPAVPRRPPVGGRAPPPPKKDAKTVATFVVRKATLESSQDSGRTGPPLPPRSSLVIFFLCVCVYICLRCVLGVVLVGVVWLLWYVFNYLL